MMVDVGFEWKNTLFLGEKLILAVSRGYAKLHIARKKLYESNAAIQTCYNHP
jgi:hypothetical protein